MTTTRRPLTTVEVGEVAGEEEPKLATSDNQQEPTAFDGARESHGENEETDSHNE